MSKKDDMKADEAATTCQAPQKEESQPDKGQLNSERIYEVIVSPKMPTKNMKDFCPTL